MNELTKGHRYLIENRGDKFSSSTLIEWLIIEVSNTAYKYEIDNTAGKQRTWIKKEDFEKSCILIEDLGIPNPITFPGYEAYKNQKPTPEKKEVKIKKLDIDEGWERMRKILDNMQKEYYPHLPKYYLGYTPNGPDKHYYTDLSEVKFKNNDGGTSTITLINKQ